MATGRAEVLKDMDLQSRGQKPSRTHRQRQMILALDKVIIQTEKCQSAVRSKCLTFVDQLIRSVICKTKSQKDAAMNDKISAKHLERAAYVYIRQSSLQQVRHNEESNRRSTRCKTELVSSASVTSC